MLDNLVARNVWLSLVIWAIVYVSDYYLTIYSARLYHAHMKEHIVFGGSYELTPQFQKDVDSLRLFSPRFALGLLLSVVALFVIWVLAVVVLGVLRFFAFAIGGVVFRELVVHARHIRNLVLFRAGAGVSGRIEYARWLTLRLSAADLLTFSAILFLVFLAAGSDLVLGGAVFTLATGLQHWSGSRKLAHTIPTR